MCACDGGYVCPRCAPREAWEASHEPDDRERDEKARYAALYAPLTPGGESDA